MKAGKHMHTSEPKQTQITCRFERLMFAVVSHKMCGEPHRLERGRPGGDRVCQLGGFLGRRNTTLLIGLGDSKSRWLFR